MKILIDIAHPAHVHFFRNAIREWRNHGHQVFVTVRTKKLVQDLLSYYDINYVVASIERGPGLLSLALTFAKHTWNVLKAIRQFNPDIVISISSPMAALAARLVGIDHIAFDDTEHANLEHILYLPFTKTVYTPTSFTKDFGQKQKRYPGFHELAYLHPTRFSANPAPLAEYGIDPSKPFYIVRVVAWEASHDIGHRGFEHGEVKRLVDFLSSKGSVLVSSEASGKTEIADSGVEVHPTKMHDLLFYADLYIGEGGTMATEAALLGTPSIFVSTLTAGNWQELETRHELMYSFKSGAPATMKAEELLSIPNLKEIWQKRRQKMLTQKIDVTKFIVEEIEKFAN